MLTEAFLRTGSVEVTPDIAEELLKAADQYMLEGLKRLCEAAISTGLCTDNLASVHDLSENYNAPQLARRCVLYSLEHYEDMVRFLTPSCSDLPLKHTWTAPSTYIGWFDARYLKPVT